MSEKKMEKTWAEHWETADLPWDAGEPAPALVDLLAARTLDVPVTKDGQPKRALVAGCGSGYDVFALAKAGYQTTGLDIAPGARAAFERKREEAGLSAHSAEIRILDFFDDAAAFGGPFDLVWDYTFFCAIPRERRSEWISQMHASLKPGGQLVMLLYPVVPGAPLEQGPPFPLDPATVEQDLAPYFTVQEVTKVSRSHPARVGKEWLARFEKRAP